MRSTSWRPPSVVHSHAYSLLTPRTTGSKRCAAGCDYTRPCFARPSVIEPQASPCNPEAQTTWGPADTGHGAQPILEPGGGSLSAPKPNAHTRAHPPPPHPGERLELYPSPALPSLASGLAGLLDVGAVITIDYGADAHTLINSARRVPPSPARLHTQPRTTRSDTPTAAATTTATATGSSSGTAAAAALAAALADRASENRSTSGLRVRSRLPARKGEGATLALSRPGWSDLTTDVDFTELSAAGESSGLRTVFFGPQSALERVAVERVPLDGGGSKVEGGEAEAVRVRVADSHPPLRAGVCDAFYALGSFVMLVQVTPSLAKRYSWRVASSSLYAASHASVGEMAMLHMLRALGRLALGHALEIKPAGEQVSAHTRSPRLGRES